MKLSISNIRKWLQNPFWARKILGWMLRYKIWDFFWLNIPSSQFWEDLILNYLIRKDKWFYVDIWANDPRVWNNTYFFYKKWWKWISIEPNKDLIKNIKKIRPRDINLNIAIWNTEWVLKFYDIDIHGMSTCSIDTLEHYKKQWHIVSWTYDISVMPLSKVLDEYLWSHTIDILSIDVEGMDMDVLQSNDWARYQPEYIILETANYVSDQEPWSKENEAEFSNYLKEFWYSKIADTYVNSIYHKNNSHAI
jgi:FkbM family methyltransferase